MYATVEEATNRLRNTIVDFDGAPVLIFDITGRREDITLHYHPWPFNGAGPDSAHISDERWGKFVPPKLGFMNHFDSRRGINNCAWCSRTPSRSMQQGLVDRNFSAVTINSQWQWTLSDIRGSDAFKEMFAGEYPEYEEVRDLLVPNTAIAVDRDFALAMSVEGYTSLYYQRDNLGLVMRDVLYLRQDRQWIREMILECPKLPNDIQNL